MALNGNRFRMGWPNQQGGGYGKPGEYSNPQLQPFIAAGCSGLRVGIDVGSELVP